MKKTMLALGAMMMVGSAAMAAPIQQSGAHTTTISAGTNESYIEHKLNSNWTIGVDRADRDEYGVNKDAYVYYDVVLTNLKVIGGYRWDMKNMDSKSNFYGGLAASTPKILGFDLYASYVAGKDFNETQVGINKNIIANVDLNVNYHNTKPDHHKRENGVGVGLSVKF